LKWKGEICGNWKLKFYWIPQTLKFLAASDNQVKGVAIYMSFMRVIRNLTYMFFLDGC
jgi:hypothetical protein